MTLPPLVSPRRLSDRLDAVRVVDATLFLAEHARDAAAEHRAAHIPGARFLDLASLRDGDSDLPNMAPAGAAFAARLAALGIGAEEPVVLYDDSPLRSAARAWWLFRQFGHCDVAILDGGLAGWRAEGLPLAAGAPDAAPVAAGARRVPDVDVATRADVAATVAAGGQLVDTRGPGRFAGTEPEPHPGIAPGHIPGSRNLHYATLFDADGRWLRGDALRAAFAAAGVDPARPMVATCGSGVTAAAILFAAHLLGNDAARLYDGSWSEWGGRSDTPKATGRA